MVTPSKALGNRTPEQLKVTELREELRKRGIQIKGLKKDLVDRLEDVLRQEEMEQQKTFETNGPAPVDSVLPDPVTPVKMKHSKDHAHAAVEEHAYNVVSGPAIAVTMDETEVPGSPKNIALPSEHPTEEPTVLSVPDAETKSQEEDTSFHSIAAEETEKSETASQNARVEADEIATASEVLVTQPVTAVGESREPVLEIAEDEDKHANRESPLEIKEDAVEEGVLAEVVLKVSNESLERKEEPQVQEVREEIIHTVHEEILSERSTDGVPAVGGVVDEAVGEEEEVVTRTVEKTVVTTAEDQIVSVVSKDLNDTGGQLIVQEERIVTTSTTVTSLEESATAVTTTEETSTTVVKSEEISTLVVAGEDLKRDAEVVETLECKSDDPMGEAPMEDVIKEADEATAAEKLNDGTLMDVDADSLKGSKRKGADGENTASEPTKRRRWNSTKGDGDGKGPGKEIQPLELLESTSRDAVISPNAPVSSAAALTPKSIPSDKLAVTRTAPVRMEASGNGESQKTRVVPPSAKPATTSLKIDRFLRPFTFKAVKELLALTGTVQDIWMDQIKTHCYVTYSSVEEATATRNALYNLQWPPQGGRLLTAEFVDPSDVKLRSDGDKASAAVASTPTVAPSTNASTPRGVMSANSKASTDGAASLPPPPPLPLPSKDKTNKQEVERTPTLDDLFRKTRSKPHIYYLPLTAQEVADKVAAKNREAATKPAAKA
ncbi:uncharacterized protein [Physcomitrium patens]|uniref:SAP domain-containing protein n=1 Tax=Physcomitrium patens TaxID=3218 RepID=A0A7I4EIT9_PHYPA|nr:apoptotic chromatin condensation inducer in the nucleus-like isoform X2 [Physcomitrium patens]|eukprot:XP_024383667.1 apoptotic chromatin condensation inducer in the nucleus-like isoform X2 [Physcomitrella patens]